MNTTDTATEPARLKLQPTQLAAKVAARNAVHRMAQELTPALREALAGFVGKKVLNQGNILGERARAALKAALPPTVKPWQALFRGSYSNIRVEFEAEEHYPARGYDGCHPCKAAVVVDLAEVDHTTNIMTGISKEDVSLLRTDYTQAEVAQARERLAAAEHEKSEAEAGIAFWGRYDQ